MVMNTSMEPQTQNSSLTSIKIIIIGAIMIVLASAVGVFIGVTYFSHIADMAPTVFAATPTNGGIVVGTPADTRTIPGTVTAISGNTFTLHTVNSSDPALADRTVTVTSETTITKIVQKDKATLSADMKAFSDAVAAAKSKPQLIVPPSQFTTVSASPSEVTIGSLVVVTTNTGAETTQQSFSAASITIQAPVKN